MTFAYNVTRYKGTHINAIPLFEKRKKKHIIYAH